MIKKNIKLLIGIVIGGIVFGSIGVYGAGKLYASSIDVDTSKMSELGETSNVNLALNYLYGKASQVGECPKRTKCIKYIQSGEACPNGFTCCETSTFVQNLKVGDLIKMTPTNTSVKLDGNKSGYTTYNTTATYINPSELKYWRVIKKNDDGTIDVVSEYVSSVDVYFSGTIGYQHFIGYLNELASYYENPAYTIDSRHMGYNRQTQYITNTNTFNGSSNNAPWTHSTNDTTTSAEELLGAGDMGYLIDYDLVQIAYTGTVYDTDSSKTTDQTKAYKVGTTIATNYWLASRYYYYGSSSFFCFYGRQVDTGGSNSLSSLRNYDSGYGGWINPIRNYALRPILTLKSTVTNGGGIESSTGAYILG